MEPWSWIVVLVVFALFFVFLNIRQKKQEKKVYDFLDTLKVGDKVVTHIGIFGKIKRIYNTSYGKMCVLEIGVNNKVDVEIELRYIAGIDEKVSVPDEAPTSEPKKEQSEKKETKKSTTKENKNEKM